MTLWTPAGDTVGSGLESVFVGTFTISSGAALSNQQWPLGLHLAGIQVPAGWTTAAITLLATMDNVTWQGVNDNNASEVTIQATAGRYTEIPPGLLGKLLGVQFRSGTTATPVNQASTVVLQAFFTPYR